jgi:hypothetical protein
VPTVLNPNPTTNPTISFTYSLPPNQVKSTTIQLEARAINSLGIISGPDFTSVTYSPLPDVVTGTTALYRVNNRRLVITASSSVNSAQVDLMLQPYLAIDGTTYNPDPAAGGVGNVFTNLGGGLYSLTLNGVPEPKIPAAKPLQVKSNLGGASPFFALTKIQ